MLNEEQQLVLDDFLNSDDRIYFLKGAAGVGKSYLLTQIIKVFKGSVIITATTNKAKNLLKQALDKECFTTQVACGYTLGISGRDQVLTKVNECKEADLFVVDEVSMLTQQVYNTLKNSGNKKILLVGDICQLPAIGLRADLSDVDKSYILTTQMRQEDNQELREYFERLRASTNSKCLFNFTKDTPSNIIVYEEHKEFCKAYLDCEVSKRILAFQNKTIDSYNLNINQGIKFSMGDLLVINKPLGRAKNGDIVEVVDVDEKEDYYSLWVAFNGVISFIEVYKSTIKLQKELEGVSLEDYWDKMDNVYEPKHIFASTIHKAQGISIDEVFIDVADIFTQLVKKPTRFNNYAKPISIQDYAKLIYVAISRMRVKAHLFIGTKREYKYLQRRDK